MGSKANCTKLHGSPKVQGRTGLHNPTPAFGGVVVGLMGTPQMVLYSNSHPVTKVHPPLEYNTIWTQRSGVSWHAQNSKCSDLTPPCSDWTSEHCNGNIGFGLDSMDRQPIPWDLRQIARNCTGVPKSKAGLDCTTPPPHLGGW